MGDKLPNVEVEQLFARYQGIRQYIGSNDEDVARIRSAAPVILPHLGELVEDFYDAIQQNEHTRSRITGGRQQVNRLKETLASWLRELLAGNYDRDYVARRWLVGWRHVEIGLRQVFVSAAASRLRTGMLRIYHEQSSGDEQDRRATEIAINRLIDLDLAIIQDAYEAEKHVRSEAAFRSLVEAADCAIVILRSDHTIVYINPFAESLTGYSSSAVAGKDYFSIFLPPEEQEGVAEQIGQVLDDTPAVGYENQIICHDGCQRTLAWNARRLDEFAGDAAVLAVGHDVTELKHVQERALQAERLAAIGQTMAGLAHESRNAFQRIQACLEMLQLEIEDRPEAMELVQRIQRAQNQLHQLNEEVRSYAAPIRLDRQKCDLPALWREVWSHLEVDRQDKQVELREIASEAPTQCDVDLFAFGQVIRNVLENAIAACPAKGGCIEIGMIRCDAAEQSLCLSIRDNGPGLADDVRQRLFEPFFTTKTKGTGLGLAIAKRIIDAHGGTITAGSHPRGGAEICITLPAFQG